MADPSTTRPNAPVSAAPSPAHVTGGTSGSSSSNAATKPSADVDELGETVAGEFGAAAKVVAGDPSLVSRVISVGTPSRSDELLTVGGPTDGGLFTNDSDGTASVSSISKKMHAQTLAGLIPPPELQAAAAESLAQAPATAAKPAPPAAPPKPAPPSAPSKLPLPPPRPGFIPGKPGSTPPQATATPRPGAVGPTFGAPPRPGQSQPPRPAMQPPPLPPSAGAPGSRTTTPPPAPGFVQQDPLGKRSSGTMPVVNAPPPPGDPRRTNQAIPAMAPPPVPVDPRRSSQAMPAVTPPPAAVDPRRSNQALPAMAPPPVPVDPRRSSQAMPVVTPPAAPSDPRRSSAGMPAVTTPIPEMEGIPEELLSAKLGSGTIPMINTAQPGASPNPPANPAANPAANVPRVEFNPPKMIYAPGTVIAGKYRLERVLGQGGMGAVWVVRNLSLDADFALKLIRRDRATEEAAARLLTEARAAAKLGHPGIVRVFDFGQTEVGDPYLVMEFLTGDSLGALITRKKRLEPGVAVQMLLPVAAALGAAHAKGIVHRDLKPDNIMLSTDDSSRKLVPKVLDFGIARVLRDDIERHQTMAGEVLGSPDYMSPEQARGQLDIDHRTDVWTFAVLLYESITGKRPFEGHNYNALISSIISNPPMPIHAYGIADTELSGIIDRGLSKSPTARWQTMRDMGTALAAWAVSHGIHQDISGMSIQTEWLGSHTPQLLTLQPAQLPRVAVPGAEPQGAPSTAPVVARDGADWQGLRGDGRRKWIIGGALLAVSIGVFIFLSATSSLFSTSVMPTANSGAEGPTPAPSASAARVEPTATTPPPVTSDTAPQPSARTSAATKTSAGPTSTTPVPPFTTKRKAPPVPTNIKF